MGGLYYLRNGMLSSITIFELHAHPPMFGSNRFRYICISAPSRGTTPIYPKSEIQNPEGGLNLRAMQNEVLIRALSLSIFR